MFAKQEIDRTRKEYGIPESVPYPSVIEVVEHIEERPAIGALDESPVSLPEWGEVEAGGAYAAAIRGANEMRRRGGPKGLPTEHPDSYPHPPVPLRDMFTWPIERERGIPAW